MPPITHPITGFDAADLESVTVRPPLAPAAWLGMDPTEAHPDALPYSLNLDHAANPTQRDNVIHRWGVNIASNGWPVVSGEPSVSYEFEELYETGGQSFVEAHVAAVRDVDGTLRRPLSFQWERGALGTTLNWALTGRVIYLVDAVDGTTSRAKGDFASDLWRWYAMDFYYETNDKLVALQRNAAGTGYVGLLKLDGSDYIAIGTGGDKNPAGILAHTDLRFADGKAIVHHSSGAGLLFGTSADPINQIQVRHGGSDVLRFMEAVATPGWDYLMQFASGGFGVRDEKNGSKTPFYVEFNAPNAAFRIKTTGRVGISTDNPEIGMHLAGGEAGLGLAERTAPGNPPDGLGFLYIDSATGNLVARITHGTVTKTITVADYVAA